MCFKRKLKLHEFTGNIYLNIYRKLEDEIAMISSGHCDSKLAEIWEQIQK